MWTWRRLTWEAPEEITKGNDTTMTTSVKSEAERLQDEMIALASTTIHDPTMAAPTGVSRTYELVPIAEVLDDVLNRRIPGHQRKISVAKARKIAREFNVLAFGALHVSKRANGKLWFVDGQHRAYAARMKGLDYVPAFVYTGLTLEGEAELWEKLNTQNRPMAWDGFAARAIYGEDEAADIRRAVYACGFNIPETLGGGNNRSISAVAALTTIYRGGGSGMLRDVLYIIGTVWPNSRAAITADILTGLYLLLHTFGEEVNTKRLIEKLSTVSPQYIGQEASKYAMTSQRGRRAAITYAMAGLYNKRSREKLDIDKIRHSGGRPRYD